MLTIILTKVTASLYLDQDHGNFSRIFHSVDSPEWDVDGLVFADELYLIIHSNLGSAFYYDPMFRPVVMALQAQCRARVYHDPFDLEPRTDDQAFVPAPRTIIAGQLHRLRSAAFLESIDGLFYPLRLGFIGD